MKKIMLVTITLLIVSCTSIKVPGYNSGVSVNLVEKDYDILGDVILEGTQRSIFGIINWGGATYFGLLEEAKNQYGANDVINISLDQKGSAFLGVYTSQKYIIRGLAIKYK